MKKRVFIKSSHALAGVLETLLLIGLVVMILATIQIYYIPDIMEQRESEHMNKVSNQFSQLKSTIEIQSMMGVLNEDEAIARSPISSPITLGSDKLPYFVTSWALGNVKIIDKDAAGESRIVIWPAPEDFINGVIPLTSINYEANNAYFVDQSYILQGGGLILKQPDGETMKIAPPILVENNSDSINIIYSLPIYISRAGKNQSATMIDDVYIRTNYIKSYKHADLSGDTEIHIYTKYIDAWSQSLINDDSGILWEYYTNGYINVDVDHTTNPSNIKITNGTKNITVECTIVEIGAQIGPGFIN